MIESCIGIGFLEWVSLNKYPSESGSGQPSGHIELEWFGQEPSSPIKN